MPANLATRSLKALLPNSSRRTRQVRAEQQVQEARQELVEAGIQQEKPDGSYEFTPETLTEDTTPNDIPGMLDDYEARRQEATTNVATAVMEPGGAVLPGSLPDADPAVDPWDIGAPEVDTVVRGVKELDDKALQRLDDGDGVVEELNAELEDQPAFEPVDMSVMVAPADRLAAPATPYTEQVARLDNENLIALASPQSSELLYRRVQELTGKEFEEFTRQDVLAGVQSLANKDNLQVLPGRVEPAAMALADVNAIQVDPTRFQFKQGVDPESGAQKGNSLSGVDKWATDFEGAIDVWEDPADGKTYVVNGHNRLAKARELGIPSLPVNFIRAATADQARAQGAAKNIAEGAGTVFDAAKYIRETGAKTGADLQALGLPLKSGNAAQGLALSKLPPGVFQDAVDGKLPVSTAIAIGNSVLSPEDMIRVAGMTQDMGPMAALELVEMAETAPKVEAETMGLFGAEMMDTIKIKAEIAAKIRAELKSTQNTFKGAAKDRNAQRLAQANTNVDQSAASTQADLVGQTLGVFDAEKYAAGTPISQLLDQATQEVAEGANRAMVVRRLVADIADRAGEVPAPKAAAPEPAALTPEQGWELLSTEEARLKRERSEKKLLTERMIKNRKKLISDADDALANGTDIDLKKVEKAQRALDAHAEADAYIAWYDQRNDLPMTAQQRADMEARIIKKAIQKGEVRPSATPLSGDNSKAKTLEELAAGADPISAAARATAGR